MTESESYLSSYVHNVLVELPFEVSNNGLDAIDCNVDSFYVTDKLLLKWDQIHLIFGYLPDDFNVLEQSTEWYKSILRKVWEVLHEAGKSLLNANLQLRDKLWSTCPNMKNIIDFERCFKILLSNTADSKLQVLLILTASLERFLGNVYLIKGKTVPFLLRDLLLTKELQDIFGRISITFTQLLVGCPLGLNVRNVAWHGFFSKNEISLHLVASLFVLFASLNDILVNSSNQIFPERDSVTFNFHSSILKSSFPDISSHETLVMEIINNSSIIPKSHTCFWKESFDNFINCRYGECLVVLLTQLEHLLRIVYCKVNNCPNRLLTAEATDFYTTLDEILSPPSEDCDNLMIEFLGNNLTEVLEDILIYPEGPRIRDKISHGECDLFNENNKENMNVLCNTVYSVALGVLIESSKKLEFCNECDVLKRETHFKTITDCKKCSLRKTKLSGLNFLDESLKLYKPKFHPISYLLRAVETELNKLMQWNQLPRPLEYQNKISFEEQIINDISRLQLVILEKNYCKKDVNNFINSDEFILIVKDHLKSINYLTLHRPRKEGILITLMRHIVTKINILNEAIENIFTVKYSQWNEHKMRSRTREIYMTMLQFVPRLQVTVICIISIMLFEIQCINESSRNWKNTNRYLKSTLKFIENIISYCNIEKNQWHEITKLTKQFVDFSNCYITEK